MSLNIDYWREQMKKVLNDDRAKIGYKVVDGVKSFKPATGLALQKIRYKLDQITTRESREYGCFAVFTSLERAKDFFDRSIGTKILLVGYTLCIGRDKSEMWKKLPPHFSKSRYKGGGYYAESSGTTELALKEAPRGTVLAESIYVIGIIDV